jgi:hypothetical protein
VNESLFREDPKNFLHVVPSEGFAACERQLEGRAFDVIDEDVEVVRIDQRALG